MNAPSVRLAYLFRLACAMCFIGHGAFGLITKSIWCNYFGVFGIGKDLAYQLMPLVGGVDILMGVMLLVYPLRLFAAWLIFWGVFTALLRPLSGESFAEFLERAGNYGAPLVLIVLTRGQGLRVKDLLKKIQPPPVVADMQWKVIQKVMRVAGFALLLGHGWLNLIGKPGLLNRYASLGFEDPLRVAYLAGVFEIAGAVLVLLKPTRHIVLMLLIWKAASELFYPAYPVWEWVERGGSYAILLGLWLTLQAHQRQAAGMPAHAA